MDAWLGRRPGCPHFGGCYESGRIGRRNQRVDHHPAAAQRRSRGQTTLEGRHPPMWYGCARGSRQRCSRRGAAGGPGRAAMVATATPTTASINPAGVMSTFTIAAARRRTLGRRRGRLGADQTSANDASSSSRRRCSSGENDTLNLSSIDVQRLCLASGKSRSTAWRSPRRNHGTSAGCGQDGDANAQSRRRSPRGRCPGNASSCT